MNMFHVQHFQCLFMSPENQLFVCHAGNDESTPSQVISVAP